MWTSNEASQYLCFEYKDFYYTVFALKSIRDEKDYEDQINQLKNEKFELQVKFGDLEELYAVSVSGQENMGGQLG